MIKELKESYSRNYEITNIDDMMSNMFGNMPDDSFDDQMKTFRKYAKELGVKDFTKVVVLIDSDNIFADVESDIPHKMDSMNWTDFYYFKNEADCNKFIKDADTDVLDESYEYANVDYTIDKANNLFDRVCSYKDNEDFSVALETFDTRIVKKVYSLCSNLVSELKNYLSQA